MQKQKAFTLIELMITVGIVGILATIAYPSYQNSVIKSRRADAKSALLELANFMERHATEANCYTDPGTDGLCDTADDSAPALPFTATPRTGTAYYTLAIAAIDAVSYTLTATPIVGTSQENDDCGSLSLTNTGIKSSTGLTAADCW